MPKSQNHKTNNEQKKIERERDKKQYLNRHKKMKWGHTAHSTFASLNGLVPVMRQWWRFISNYNANFDISIT